MEFLAAAREAAEKAFWQEHPENKTVEDTIESSKYEGSCIRNISSIMDMLFISAKKYEGLEQKYGKIAVFHVA